MNQLYKLNTATGLKGQLLNLGIHKLIKWNAKRQKSKLETALVDEEINKALSHKDEAIMIAKLMELEDYL